MLYSYLPKVILLLLSLGMIPMTIEVVLFINVFV